MSLITLSGRYVEYESIKNDPLPSFLEEVAQVIEVNIFPRGAKVNAIETKCDFSFAKQISVVYRKLSTLTLHLLSSRSPSSSNFFIRGKNLHDEVPNVPTTDI